jgi:putative N-acetylmannosamine-6-phosphate epimerase
MILGNRAADSHELEALPLIRRLLCGKVIVSCQAPEGDAFRQSESMARFARAAVDGGAAGIRANGTDDIAAIHRAVSVPIIGIEKRLRPDGSVQITPTLEMARRLVKAGSAIIAVGCTRQDAQAGSLETVRKIPLELGVPVMADIATVQEAVAAAEAGAAFVLSTLRGYTTDTAQITRFEPAFIRDLCQAVSVPVIAEGRIHRPEQAREAMEAGAFAVIIGTAITRPAEITRGFVNAM